MTIEDDDPGNRLVRTSSVVVRAGDVALMGELTLVEDPMGIIIFAHGSGSGRTSPRNQRVARALADAGFVTLLFDLLTEGEELAERYTRHLRFNIPLLADRLIGAIDWAAGRPPLRSLPVGLFGASTGAAAALVAAARRERVAAVVSRGGRPDLAGDVLPDVRCPTMLLVGGSDSEVLDLNLQAMKQMTAPTTLHVVAGATHLFEEPGALEEVTQQATQWFRRWLRHELHEPAHATT